MRSAAVEAVRRGPGFAMEGEVEGEVPDLSPTQRVSQDGEDMEGVDEGFVTTDRYGGAPQAPNKPPSPSR